MKYLLPAASVLLCLATIASASDVSVLQVDVKESEITIFPDGGGTHTIKMSDCAAIPNVPSSVPANATPKNCSTAVETIEKAAYDTALPPLVTSFSYTPMTSNCELIDIQTVTLQSKLDAPTFEGIGFSYNDTNCGDGTSPSVINTPRGLFVPKAQLDEIGDQVTTVGGQLARVHHFIAQGYCMGVGDDGYGYTTYGATFKPFARYTDNGDVYAAESNTAAGCVAGDGEQSGDIVRQIRNQSWLLKQ